MLKFFKYTILNYTIIEISQALCVCSHKCDDYWERNQQYNKPYQGWDSLSHSFTVHGVNTHKASKWSTILWNKQRLILYKIMLVVMLLTVKEITAEWRTPASNAVSEPFKVYCVFYFLLSKWKLQCTVTISNRSISAFIKLLQFVFYFVKQLHAWVSTHNASTYSIMGADNELSTLLICGHYVCSLKHETPWRSPW